MAAWALLTSAQGIDSDPCRDACRAQHSACIDACGAHPDPVECEATCRDQLFDCLAECR